MWHKIRRFDKIEIIDGFAVILLKQRLLLRAYCFAGVKIWKRGLSVC